MRRWFLVLALALLCIAWILREPIAQQVDAWRLRPRVLTGGDRFETITVTDRESVRQAGAFDGEPGDELALVTFRSLQLLTPSTLTERQRLDLGTDVFSGWTPSTRLARVGGALVIVDTGDGLQETRVRDLNGSERWRYRPDGDIPSSSLVPADLDGDGDAEFYAAIADAIVRLDGTGQEIWRAPFASGRIVTTAPRTRRDPPWIVAAGGQVAIWNELGMPLGSVVMKDARPLGIIEWPDGRFVLGGGSAARAIALDGTVTFEWPVPGMRVVQAVAVSLEPGAPPVLALVAEGPRDTSRWRLQIVSRGKTLLYDEILDSPAQLLKARGADGTDHLFISRASLLTLRATGG